MKLLLLPCLLAVVGWGAALITPTANYPRKKLSEIQAIQDCKDSYGEAPSEAHLVTNVKCTASSLIDTNLGNDQCPIDKGSVLLNRAKDDPNDKSKKTPVVLVELPDSLSVCGIVIGGRPTWTNDHNIEVEVEASSDQKYWFKATKDDGTSKFQANKNGVDLAAVYFSQPIIGKFLKVSSAKIIPGAAAAFRIAAIVNCKYDDAIDLGNYCDKTMAVDPLLGMPDCKKLRVYCPAGECTMQRDAWGKDPFTYDSPICYCAQLEFTSLGDGNFVAYKLPTYTNYGALGRKGLISIPYLNTPYKGYTFKYEEYAKACKNRR